MDLPTKGVGVARVALEEHHRGPVFAFVAIVGGPSSEASINLLAINLKLKLVDTPSWRLRVVPETEGRQSYRLLEQEHDGVGLTLFAGVLLGGGGVGMAFRILVRSQPDVVVLGGLVLSINSV